MMQVGEIVKAIREQEGWSQPEAGGRIGVRGSQISNVENGRNDLPASKLLKLMEEAGWRIVSPEIVIPERTYS